MTWTTTIRCTNHRHAPVIAESVFLELTRAAGGSENTPRIDWTAEYPERYEDGRRVVQNKPQGLKASIAMSTALEAPLNWRDDEPGHDDGLDHLVEWRIDTPYSCTENQYPILRHLIRFINDEGLCLDDFSWRACEVKAGWWPLNDSLTARPGS